MRLVPFMMLLMMHQPHLHQPWRLDAYSSQSVFDQQRSMTIYQRYDQPAAATAAAKVSNDMLF